MCDGSALSHRQILTPDPVKTVTNSIEAGTEVSRTAVLLKGLAAVYSLTVFFSALSSTALAVAGCEGRRSPLLFYGGERWAQMASRLSALRPYS